MAPLCFNILSGCTQTPACTLVCGMGGPMTAKKPKKGAKGKEPEAPPSTHLTAIEDSQQKHAAKKKAAAEKGAKTRAANAKKKGKK